MDKLEQQKINNLLDTIDKFLSKGNYESVTCLWDILSALRGPDFSDPLKLKDMTTVYIRRKAFPKTAKRIGPIVQFTSGYKELTNEELLQTLASHFTVHIEYARKALKVIGRDHE